MNKKANTLLFILGATVFNIVTIVVIFIILQVLIMLLFRENTQLIAVLLFPALLLAIVGNFFLYRFVLKRVDEKFHLEQYLEPLFFKRK